MSKKKKKVQVIFQFRNFYKGHKAKFVLVCGSIGEPKVDIINDLIIFE